MHKSGRSEHYLNTISTISICYSFKIIPLAKFSVFIENTNQVYGGFILKHLLKICSAKFNKFEHETNSTFRELLAVKNVLCSFRKLLKNQIVRLNIANYSACKILWIGIAKPHL